MKKRILSMLLACMLLNSLPVAAFAKEVQPECSHVCDESCGYVAPAAAVACDKDCKPAEEGGEVTHVEGCAYKAAEEGSPCTHKHNGECGVECAHNYVDGKCACGAECTHNYVEGVCTVCNMAESKPVCNCGTDDASIHATTCAVYAVPEKPECHCVEKCLEANIWCDVCGIDYSLCGGTGKAEAYTDHKHCLSVHEDCTGHDDAVTWTAWEKTDSLPTSGNYYLTKDVILSQRHKVSSTLSLCLNGHTITPSESGFGAIEVTGNLSLTDCQGNGKITGFTNKFGKGGGVYSGGTFTMHGGTISDNVASFFGGGVYIAPGKQFTMSGGTISDNKVTTAGNAHNYGGGGVYSDGTFTMSGGTIKNNKANTMGGGVCISNIPDSTATSTFTMHNGTIIDNEAPDGGGVYIDSGKQFTMSDGTISGNTSTAFGGGVRVNGTFNMSNGTISGNNAGYGGGVYISPTSASFTMTGGNITGNAATNNGGGVYMYEGAKAFELSGSPTISGNTGGNCYIDNHDNCFMTVTGALGENARIGITTWSSMSDLPFCKPAGSIVLSNYKNWFFSDRVDRAIAKNDDGSLYTTIVNTYAMHFDSTQAKVTVRGIETTKAAEGDIVVISPIVPEGATVESVTATGCTVTDHGDGTYSFTMPAKAVTITVTFNSPTVDVTGVTLVKDTLELAMGDSETLTAIVAPDNATNKKVSWISSNTEVATVDETGKVTAVGAGTATITVKTEDGEFTDTRTVTVVEKYDVWVAGEQFTSKKLTINGATGTASFDPTTNTLTLDNFSYTGAGYQTEYYSAAICALDNLNIKLVGTNNITCQSNDTSVNCRAISVWYGKEFNTTGHLTITGTDKPSDKLICTANSGLIAVRSVTVDSATIQMNDGAIESVVSDVTINNSVVAAAEVNGGHVTVENSKIETENELAATDDLTITNSTVTGGSLAAWDDASVTTITASQINVTGISACVLYVKNQSSVTAELVMGKAISFENSTVRVTGTELLEDGKTYAIIVDGIGEGGVSISNSTIEAYGSEGACLRMQDSFTTFVPVTPVYFVGEQIVTDDGYMVTAGADKASATEVADPTAETYASKYVRIVPAYTVTYMVGEDEVYTEKVESGKDVVHVPEVPAKEGYTGKWDHDGKNITADTEINAVYTVKKYTVTYKADGKVVEIVEVEHGKDATAPEIPAKVGYNETAPKWDKDGKNITADTTINAVYTKNQPGTFTSITPTTNAGGGKITDEVHKLKEKIPFTQEEALQIEYGADVEVWLEVEDISASVPADDKKEIEKKLGDGDVAMYLDIVMFKQVGENEASRLTQLSDKVQICFKLADSLINTDKNVTRTYSIIRVHNGKAEIITPVFDAATKTLTFETDRFSTYGVVYTDEKITPPAEETVSPTEKPTPPAEIPATGDRFQPVFWIACMTLSIFGIAVLLLDAKRRHAR